MIKCIYCSINIHKKEIFTRRKGTKKAANITKEVLHDNFYHGRQNRKYDRNTFINNFSTTSYKKTTDKNMTNLQDVETWFTVGYSGIITGMKHRA